MVDPVRLAVLIVLIDQARHKFAEEDCAPVAEDRAILLRAMGVHHQITIFFDSALKHDGAGLVNWDFLVSHAAVVVSHAPVTINDWSFALPRVDLENMREEARIQLLDKLRFEELLVDEGNWLRHCLNHGLV